MAVILDRRRKNQCMSCAQHGKWATLQSEEPHITYTTFPTAHHSGQNKWDIFCKNIGKETVRVILHFLNFTFIFVLLTEEMVPYFCYQNDSSNKYPPYNCMACCIYTFWPWSSWIHFRENINIFVIFSISQKAQSDESLPQYHACCCPGDGV